MQTKIRFTKENGDIKLWRLVTFESYELEQSYIHQLKALMCGNNAWRGQGHGCRFTMCHASLKMALLLHKQGLVKTTVQMTVTSFMFWPAVRGSQVTNKSANEKSVLLSKVAKINPFKIWRLVTFESLEIYQSYTPFWKPLISFSLETEDQGCDSTFRVCYTVLKNAISL